MYFYLNRLGRKRWVSFIMPVVTGVTGFVYLSCHTYLHHKMRDILAADRPDGRREEISDQLRDLIRNVYTEVKDELNRPTNRIEEYLRKDNKITNPIKWFSSSTLEPITFGSTSFKTGTLIGLPKFFNYTSVDQIPDSMFEMGQIKLFKSPQNTELEKREQEDFELATGRQKISRPVKRIDRYSPEGMDYASSLMLSDNAKKFSIAREMFLADTARPLMKTAMIIGVMALGSIVGRSGVILTSAQQAHVSRRLLCYMLGGLTVVVTYQNFNAHVDSFYGKDADERAKKVGPMYEEGFTEYYAKRAMRNHCLGIN